MKISIIIPTFNASEHLPALLKALAAQTFAQYELIVIDSSSRDNTAELARSHGASTIVIPQEQFDHGGTRNMGALKAKGEIIVFMTQDSRPANEHALENLIRPITNDQKIAAVCGRQLPSTEASPVSAHLRIFNYPDASYTRSLEDRRDYGIKTIFLSDSFAAYRRELLEEIGWFKKDLLFGEDTHAAARFLLAGYRIAYAADAMVYHSHNYSYMAEFRRYFDIGVFHKTEDWLLREFGNTSKEGMKYIESGVNYLVKNHKPYLIPSFIARNALKFLGYRLGLRYKQVPHHLAARFSMNKTWWMKPR